MKRALLFLLIVSMTACGPEGRDDLGDDDGMGDGSGSGSGDGSGSGQAKQCNRMDIVFVVDDSGSMDAEQANLAANFPMFADVLANYVNADGEHIDFRVAVTTTGRDIDYVIDAGGGFTLPEHESGDNGAFRDGCGTTKRFLEPADPDMANTLSCRANVGTSGPSYEMPLLMSKWALSERVDDGTNAGFLRDDALLALVYLTDEDDDSTTANNWTITPTSGDPAPTWQPADQVQFLDTLKGNRTRWAAGVIAGDGDCSSSFGSAVDAVRLKEFVNLANSNATTQATFSSICAGDLTGALQQTLETFQAACGGIVL